MNPKTRFLKMYYKLPKKAKKSLVIWSYSPDACSMDVAWVEIHHNTVMGKKILKELGYEE